MKIGNTVIERKVMTAVALGACALASCSKSPPNALLVAISSDMRLPEDINVVEMEVTPEGGATKKHSAPYDPQTRTLQIPGTVSIQADEPEVRTVRVKVRGLATGSGGNKGEVEPVTFEFALAIPRERVGMIRAPLLWHNQGTCPDGQTMRGGKCVAVAQLPDDAAQTVTGYDAKDEACFPVEACFARYVAVSFASPPAVKCTVALDETAKRALAEKRLNFGLLRKGDDTSTIVPFSRDLVEGWTDDGDTVSFPEALCKRVESAGTLVVTGACPTKRLESSQCGPWNPDGQVKESPRPNVDGGIDITVDGGGDSGADGGNVTVTQLANSKDGTCALYSNGQIKCWGRHNTSLATNETLGDEPGELEPTFPFLPFAGAPGPVRSLAVTQAGSVQQAHCAVFASGKLRCWGSNTACVTGQTGLGTSYQNAATDVNFGAAQVKHVGIGYAHACAAMEDGTVVCWGNGRAGLGYGSLAAACPAPTTSVDLGTGVLADEIASGQYFTCARLRDGRVKCWGEGGYGQLLNGAVDDLGDGPGEMGSALPFADLGDIAGTPLTAKRIAAGESHACAILSNDRVKCWGRNDGGFLLGTGDMVSRGGSPATIGNGLPFIDLGLDDTAAERTVLDLAVAWRATCAIVKQNASKNLVLCWGAAANSLLGAPEGTGVRIGDSASEMGNALQPVSLGTGLNPVRLFAATDTMCVQFSNGGVKCWGSNVNGRLGVGTMVRAYGEPGTMGDALPWVVPPR